MIRYIVNVHEVWVRPVSVWADTPEQALQYAYAHDGDDLEEGPHYERVLPSSIKDVQEAGDDNRPVTHTFLR